ncbi:aspartate carbamoyltransferase catalytic subunit [Vaginisenegalia massiliensis]|uniref:aspartate carbamoyltransferase catalytic subunit n=1 Tax=Vaginisenegalia massiliensis TaxID=2058294 RepID=UPI000F52FEB5|nr:aspartate carbamoyltransferase catalytic subunit [Vaginisenegalia massiliensis]
MPTLIPATKKLALSHLTSVESLTDAQVLALIKQAQAFKCGQSWQADRTYYATNLFFENSTRTHRSFEMAEKKLGMQVIDFAVEHSSVNKGETLYDTVLTMDAIGVDIAVIRHSQVGYYEELIASNSIKCSIINGGDGSGQHPTQCLLDLMTIYEEFGHFDGLKIAIAGDLIHSRVAKSNMQMLKRLGAELYFCGPNIWYDEAEFNAYGQYVSIDSIIDQVDVMMLLRVQSERHDVKSMMSQDLYHNAYGLNIERANKMKPQAIIMHPAPVNRNVELADELVECPQSRIVTQMQNGVFMRMAILDAIVEGKKNNAISY